MVSLSPRQISILKRKLKPQKLDPFLFAPPSFAPGYDKAARQALVTVQEALFICENVNAVKPETDTRQLEWEADLRNRHKTGRCGSFKLILPYWEFTKAAVPALKVL